MNYHFIPKSSSRRAFERSGLPVLEVASGDIVTFETSDDAYARLGRGESPDMIPDDDYNVVTGPITVRGAEPGDSLRIEILDIAIHRAWVVWIPEYGPLGALTNRVQAKQIAFADGQAILSERLQIPLAPMIGCIGLAPQSGTASTLEPAYPFGGNLDVCELSSGSTIFLPVQTTGGWLSIGDLHAAMGAGEPAHISLEAAGEATVRVSVEKRVAYPGPLVRLADRTLCVAVLNEKETIDRASQAATEQAFNLLTSEFGMSPFEAYAYVSARVGLKFGGPASPIVIAEIPHPEFSIIKCVSAGH